MTIRLYNTMENKKVDFVPRDENAVSMYCCGPTTYNYIHLGNARPIVVFDTIRRYFMYSGFNVTYVQNFTDVDDKIINRANVEGIKPAAVAEKYIAAFFEDVAKINVLRADIHPKVTEHMPEIIEMVSSLIEKGYAYQVEGDVYFSVRKFEGYGKLSKRDLDEMQAGARVMVGDLKQDPMDFALWKSAKPGEPAWESPWGMGRPGWHIECSAMSYKYLGAGFDIHGGGIDLVFPHHENEIAQSEAFCGCDFANYWMHNGFITVNSEKMSKSVGNFFLLRDILDKFSGDVVRFYLLGTHYRSPIDFDDEKLQVATKSLGRIRTAINTLNERIAIQGEFSETADANLAKATVTAIDAFKESMDDDFNTALAIAGIFDFTKAINTHAVGADIKTLNSALEAMKGFDSVLGMLFAKDEVKVDDGLAEDLMEIIIEIRKMAKKDKNFALADFIRDELKEKGVLLEDTREGVRWKKVPR